jgi:hypothetical protein
MKKYFFSENASIHESARVPLILTFLLALIAGFFENIAKFFIAPLSSLCQHIDSCHLFPETFKK